MERLSIAEARRDLSKVVNEVAFGGKQVVLTSRGRPKAVLVGYEDFLRVTEGSSNRILRLGGLWKGTPPVSYEELREARRRVWRSFGRR